VKSGQALGERLLERLNVLSPHYVCRLAGGRLSGGPFSHNQCNHNDQRSHERFQGRKLQRES